MRRVHYLIFLIIVIVLILVFVIQKPSFFFKDKSGQPSGIGTSRNSLSNFTEFNITELGNDLCIYADCLYDGCVIRTQAEYNRNVNVSSWISCSNFQLPAIDFSRYSLLGKQTTGSGCSREYIKNVYDDNLGKRALYLIRIVENGSCEPAEYKSNWVLISKIDSSYEVKFEVNVTKQP